MIKHTTNFEDVMHIVNTLNEKEKGYICNGTFKNSPYVIYRDVLVIDDIPVAFIDVYQMDSDSSGVIVIACSAEEAYRHKGYASILLERAVAWADENSVSLVYKVKRSNAKSVGLAQKHGLSITYSE